MILEFVLPYLWAVNILQVYPLSLLVKVPVGCIEKLLCQLGQVLEVMLDGEGDDLFCREVGCILNCLLLAMRCSYCTGPAHLCRHGCRVATRE